MTLWNGVQYVKGPDVDNINRVDMGAMPMILHMTRWGMKIDPDHFKDYGKWLIEDMERVTEEVKQVSGHYINVGSADQVADLLFNKLGIVPPKNIRKTKSGARYKVDDKTLEGMKRNHPVIVLVQDYRERSKLEGTYCRPIPRFAGRDNRLHPRYKTTRVGSGRLAAEDPNLLAIPTRSELGKKIRKGFIPEDSKWTYGTIDMSQVEIRVMAHQCECKNMLTTFRRGGDIHTETAMRMFHLDKPEDVDKEAQRNPAKVTGLGVMYDMTGQGLYEQMILAKAYGWTLEACEKLIQGWFGMYPEVLVERLTRHRNAKRYGFVWDGFGRVRYVPEVKSVLQWIVSGGLREAGNFPTQAEAQALLKLAMAKIQTLLVEDLYVGEVHPLLQVHDELIFELRTVIAQDFLEDAKAIIKGIAPFYLAPLESNYAIGESWGDLVKK